MSLVEPIFQEQGRPFCATVIIVLYRIAPADSPAFRSVMNALVGHDIQAGSTQVLLWDNSPVPQPVNDLPTGVIYRSEPRNAGLANAYNWALARANEWHSEWLITLDQDTALPFNYFAKMASAAQMSTRFAGVGAIVPQIEADGKLLSPNRFLLGAIPRWYDRGYCGAPNEAVFAFNSGAMLRVAALQQVGGYNPWFWLDNSDAMIFSKLNEHGKRVFVAGDIQIQHEFSMKDMSHRMSAERYRNVLLAESAFWDLRMNRVAGWERNFRLLLRMAKHRMRNDSKELRRITWSALTRRLMMSKCKRIEEWRQKTLQQFGNRFPPSQAMRRLKVSVCMAAYNGGKFVDAQLRSILPQLHNEDEVIVVDDCSQDETVERIAGANDQRIQVLKHTRNAGVMRTFEDALRCSTGDIIFLCDDDDVWALTKVQRFLDVFAAFPDVEIVTSRAHLIDEQDKQLPNSHVNRNGKFLPGFWQNLFKNHYQGSAMAIRSTLLGRVLPFPKRNSFLHDAWIGTRNEISGGKTAFIDEDLLFYRRHSQNASQKKPLSHQILSRIELLLAHVSHLLRPTSHLDRRASNTRV